LIIALHETVAVLPEITCSVCEKFLDEFGEESQDIQTEAAGLAVMIGELVVRLYSQCDEPKTQKRCLDMIDRLEAQGRADIEKVLATLKHSHA